MRQLLGLNNLPWNGSGQTVILHEYGGAENLRSDVDAFCSVYKLPAMNTTSLVIIGQVAGDYSWSGEVQLDVDLVHLIAPQARIVVVIGSDAALSNALTTYPTASVVSMSYGGDEMLLSDAELAAKEAIFTSHPSVTFVASSGDEGCTTNSTAVTVNGVLQTSYVVGCGYPASSPSVISAGGSSISYDPSTTTFNIQGWTGADIFYANKGVSIIAGQQLTYKSYGAGGGMSRRFSKPAWQQTSAALNSFLATAGSVAYTRMADWNYDAAKRVLPDMAMPADSLPIFVTSSATASGWGAFSGTSASSPLIAGLIALANEARVSSSKAVLGSNAMAALYQNPTAFSDVVRTGTMDSSTWGQFLYYGTNADLALFSTGQRLVPGAHSCSPGFDLVTGLGHPVVSRLIPALVAY